MSRSLFFDAISTIRLDTNEPKKKKKMYRKKINACQKLSLKTSSTKKAKCPVTLVVKRCTAKNPATFTIPATKDSNDAILKLCANVLVFPLCLNIL